MSEFVGYTPEDKSNNNLQSRVDKVAGLVSHLMNTSNSDEEAWIKRAGIFQEIQTEIGYGFRKVEDLLLVQNDNNKTDEQKKLAEEAEELLVLGTAKALMGGDIQDKEAIGVGSVMKIKERLPDELKGLEKKVRDSIIDEPEIQKILDPLDIVRKRAAKAGETGQKVLEDQVSKAQEKLILLEVDSTKEDQLGMVVEWLGGEAEELKIERNDSRNTSSPEAYMRYAPGMYGGDRGGDLTGAQDAWRKTLEIGAPDNIDGESINKWIFQAVTKLSNSSLFWAGQWQQIGPYLDDQINNIFQRFGREGSIQEKINKKKELMQAVLACRIHEQAIIHCDGAPDKYASMLPPPDTMNDYLWNKDSLEELMSVEGLGEMRKQIRDWAYSPEGGEKVAKCLKSSNSINIWAEDLANSMADKGEYGEELARTAIAVFIVEDYARWAAWSCSQASKSDYKKVVPWMEAKKKISEAPNDSSIWSYRVLKKDKKGKDKMGFVEIWGANFPNTEFETCVQHPYLQFLRPVDLYRVKSSWSEEILGSLESSLKDLAIRKWMFTPDGKDFDSEKSIDNMLKPSKVGLKDFNRWNAMVSAWVGGSQADGLDNFKDWLKGAEQLKALLQSRQDVLDLGGEIAGDIFYAKTRAFMSMQNSDFLHALSIALTGGENLMDIKEIQAITQEMMGSSGVAEFGQLFESIARINLRMGTEKFKKAYAMMQTAESDPDKALILLKLKKIAINTSGLLDVSARLLGQKKK